MEEIKKGQVLYAQGKIDEAMKTYTRLIKENINSPTIFWYFLSFYFILLFNHLNIIFCNIFYLFLYSLFCDIFNLFK